MTFGEVFVAALGLMALVYSVVLSGFARGLRLLRTFRKAVPDSWPKVSVILPARNEAEVLERTLQSLFKQDYPGPWEIIVVDDRSQDDTPRILRELGAKHSRLKTVTITEANPPSPKKNALAKGIAAATGEIIVTTDADCVYDPAWLRSLIMYMVDDVGVVAGLTVFDLPTDRVPLWQKVQWLDFAVQQFLAAGAVGVGVPASCNGSNLAYRRQVYEEISGFGRFATLVSGDDVLFAQRAAKLTRWRVAFATDPASVVRSLPVLSVREMFHQRIRWASKGLAYRRSMLVFLFGMYAFYLVWIAALPVAWFYPETRGMLAGIALWKTAWDLGTLWLGCRLFGQMALLPYYPLYIVLHTILNPIFGLMGLFAPYRWKGEWYRTARLPRGVKRGIVRMRRLVQQRRAAERTT